MLTTGILTRPSADPPEAKLACDAESPDRCLSAAELASKRIALHSSKLARPCKSTTLWPHSRASPADEAALASMGLRKISVQPSPLSWLRDVEIATSGRLLADLPNRSRRKVNNMLLLCLRRAPGLHQIPAAPSARKSRCASTSLMDRIYIYNTQNHKDGKSFLFYSYVYLYKINSYFHIKLSHNFPAI